MAAKLEAVIWDMDGVIVDTGIYHLKAWQRALAKRGIKLTEPEFRQTFGKRNDLMGRVFLGPAATEDEIRAITNEKEEEYLSSVKGNLKPLPGAVELIRALEQNGIKKALASSAGMDNIKNFLKILKIDDCFQALVSGREVGASKPDPEIFLTAARALGVNPNNCIVIEDSLAGVEAAKRAGMKCIAVTTTNRLERLHQADLVVDNLTGVSVAVLKSLFTQAIS